MAISTQFSEIQHLKKRNNLRIICLIPSITELLITFNLELQLVGITDFCPTPSPQSTKIEKIGGTKTIDIQKIKQLNPDIIIANKEENTAVEILELAEKHCVWLTDIKTFEDAQHLIYNVGEVFNKAPEAEYLNHLLTQGFNDLKTLKQSISEQKSLYFIWKNPDMVAGNDTFIHHLIVNFLPLQNICTSARYPELQHVNLTTPPDWVFLASEPYPFTEKHLSVYQERFPKSKVICVDGTYFSWYGSRLLQTIHYFHELLKMMK